MAYVALYRQWRPQDFDNLVGQDHISTTLKNALATGRIAHAYLFAGPRGTGKTSTAKILAKALNCEQGPTATPCNECSACQRITAGTSMDVFEVDAASNRGIDEIRDLRDTVKYAPVEGKYKVYIIDEVHMLTTEAFNALLKTLEEPPEHVVFVLATTEAHKIPATIHSRCQRYDFRRISIQEIESRMAEVADRSGLRVAADALRLIAVHADGGMRDALSILDQCTTGESGTVTAEKVREMLGLIGHEWVRRLTQSLAARNAKDILLDLDELIAKGKDVRQVLLELALYMRSLLLYKAAPDIDSIATYAQDRTVLAEHSAQFTQSELSNIIQKLNEAANEAKWAPEPRICAEVALLSLCRQSNGTDLEALLERVATLEAKLENADFVAKRSAASKLVLAETPALAAAPKPVAAPPETMFVPAAVTAAPTTPKTETVIDGKPEATAANKPKPAFVPPAKSAVTLENTEDIWNNVLKELVANGKRSVHACVAQGKLADITESAAVIQFSAAFPKERTERDDFRAIVEKVFSDITGRSVKIHCTLGSAVAKATASSPTVQQRTGVTSDDDMQHPALRQAIKIFGGKVTKEET